MKKIVVVDIEVFVVFLETIVDIVMVENVEDILNHFELVNMDAVNLKIDMSLQEKKVQQIQLVKDFDFVHEMAVVDIDL